MVDVAKMDAEVKILLNVTLGRYSDDYRGTIRRVITGTLDEAVRKGILARHTLTGIELAPRIVTAEQYEREARLPVFVTDDTVRMLAEGITATRTDTDRPRPHPRPARAGHRPLAAAHHGPADQGGPGRPQGRLPDPQRRDPVPAPVLAGQPRTAGSWNRSSTARPATSATCPSRT